MRAIALNLERADVRRVGLPAQVERPPELGRPWRALRRATAGSAPPVIGGTTSVLRISSSALLTAFSAVFELRLAVRAGGDLLAALPVDLLDEIAILGLRDRAPS